MTIYVFLQYPHDRRWFRSRGMHSWSKVVTYLWTLPATVNVKIRVFGPEGRIV